MPRRQVDPHVERIILSYGSAARQVRARVTHFVEATWGGLDDYRNADIDRFVKRVVPVVTGGQRTVATLTDTYLAAVQEATLGVPARAAGIPTSIISAEALRGVPAHVVYARTGPTVWRALSRGVDLEGAARMGLDRAVEAATTDLQLARTHSAQYLLGKNDNVSGYRRVPGGGNVCALCAVASTQRYHSDQLMPIHPGCSCDVEPIYGADDPGQIIDPDTLDGIHSQIEERFGVSDASGRGPIDYRDIVVVHEHGELGPVLAVRGQRFTGPDDLRG